MTMHNKKIYKNIRERFNKKIYREYINYHTRQLINKLIIDKNKHPKHHLSYIETFLFLRINYMIYKKTPPYHPFNKILEVETKKYGEIWKMSIPYMDEILDLINSRYDYVDNKYKSKITIDNKFIYLYDLKFKLDARITFLLNHSKKMILEHNPEYDKNKIQNIALKLVVRCLLRYATIGITGNHCSLSSDLYNYLYDNLNVKGEGYSSPLNSKLIEKPDTVICSVFYDTDKYFKSKGAFKIDIMKKYKNINWILNPPFLSSATKLTFESIEYTFNNINTDMLIILVLPISKLRNGSVEEQQIFNKYLYGYINEKEIKIIHKNETTPRKNMVQYFICNGIYSNNFHNVHMFFYTNNPKNELEDHIYKISDLWAIGNSKSPINQSYFTAPIKN